MLILLLACATSAPKDEGPRSFDSGEDTGGDTRVDTDADGDGVSAPADCDDTNPAISPDVAETCNGADDDCDSAVDEDLPEYDYHRDADGDGWGDPETTMRGCGPDPGCRHADARGRGVD